VVTMSEFRSRWLDFQPGTPQYAGSKSSESTSATFATARVAVSEKVSAPANEAIPVAATDALPCSHWAQDTKPDALWGQIAVWDPAPPICDCCGGPVLLARPATAGDARCLVCRFAEVSEAGYLVRAALHAGAVFANPEDAALWGVQP